MAENLNTRPEYTGKEQPDEQARNEHGLHPYLPDNALIEAVNLAIYLERPLLIKGEPGCGKTRLARAVAYELGLPYEAWHIKSTSRAQDGLYTYDTVGRLRDAQLAAMQSDKNKGSVMQSDKNEGSIYTDDPEKYIRWGALGRAFQNDQHTVVLIDEIDKADIDFPNDLLLELDERRFVVEEVSEDGKPKEIKAKPSASPIVFITSNDEKDLPDAFLRRCLFHYITFPKRERLIEIVNSHFPTASEELIKAAVTRFLDLREKMQEDKGETSKRVSTSELIDWFRVLRRYPDDEALTKLGGKLPYPTVLLKSWDDHRRYLAYVDND
jgi:MoxR-like ATPase